jgi:hypothetical protein
VRRDEGGRLDHAELISMGWLLLAAGYETTGSLIGNGTLALLRNPGQLAALRADPALMGAAIEELLRYDGPVKLNPAVRYAVEDLPVGDVVVRSGDAVLFSYAAADRDPAEFRTPTGLISAAGPAAGTWRSATACTTAWARRWPGQKGRSPARRCWPAAPSWRSPWTRMS